MQSDNRPISPHMQIYRPQLTSVMSITHRATGVFLSLGAFLLAAWILAAAGTPDQYGQFQSIMSSTLGRIALFLWTYALIYHLLNGIRHLAWDAGKGLELDAAYRSGWLVIVLSIVLTAGIWALALSETGGAS